MIADKDLEPGSLVYIHYSGRGTHREFIPPNESRTGGNPLSGTALVPTDVLRGAYLTGYAGRGMRSGGAGIRTSVHEADDSMLLSDSDAQHEADYRRNRNAQLDCSESRKMMDSRPCWMTSSSTAELAGCTVLTACGIDEVAREDTFREVNQPSSRYGVFTYFMGRALKDHAGLSYRELRQRVTANSPRSG
ncbi:hypothetical protein ACJZ2D_015821 [Fusarium nematophilum]